MKKMVLVLTVAIFAAALVAPLALCAVNQTIVDDKDDIKAQRVDMTEHAMAAKSEEKEMKGQIKEASQSGDKEKAKSLRQDLRKTHKENVAQRHEDKKALNSLRKDMAQDNRNARKASQQ